ncbi:MAG: PKD domain-containing protein [Phycisphaerae bacterium]
MGRTSTSRALLILLASVAACGPVTAAEWWSDAWPYRRAVTVAASGVGQAPGDEVAVLDMPTGGLIKPGGEDIRVTTHDGREAPSRVLMVGPGDQVRVAFGLTGGVTKYYIYFGNPLKAGDPKRDESRLGTPAPQPAKQLDIKRGVLLEMWAYGEGGIKTLDQVKKAVAGAKQFIGRDFRDRIFQAHNPFGPQGRIACVWTAWFMAGKDGAYVFSTSSQDASFLLVDDVEVVDNGGFHRPQNDVSRQGSVELKAGPHKMTFYHVSGGQGDPVAVVAWKPPGGKDIKPMLPDAFLPVARAGIGPIERYGRDIEIDFIPRHAGEAFVADRYFQRYTFEALAVGRVGAGVQWQWDFGDGQSSFVAKTDHVYLLNGEYTVTLTAKTFAGTLTRTNKVFVSRPWDQVTENKLDSVAQQAIIVSAYDFKAASADAAAEAIVILHRAAVKDSTKDAILKAGDALIGKDSASPKLLAEAVPLYADVLAADNQADKAAAALDKGAKMTSDPAVCAALLVKAGQVVLEKGDAAEAQKIFAGVVDKYARLTTATAIREARIGMGDAWRLAGDLDKARDAYTAAKTRLDSGQTAAVVRGDFARHVEDYVRSKTLESARQYIDKWEDALPLDKLEGYLSLMKARYLVAKGSHAEAAREVELLVKVNPTSNYAPELLMLAADAYGKINKPDQATAALKMIVEKYPESPLSIEAAKKLRK